MNIVRGISVMPVDKEWVIERLNEKGWSMRRLGDEIGWDIATISRALNGKRPFRIGEVSMIANALGVSVQEILPRLGLKPREGGVPVQWEMDCGAHLHPAREDDRIVTTMSIPRGTVGIVVRCAESPIDAFDGWTLLVPPIRQGIDPTAIGMLSLVTPEEGEPRIMKVVRMLDKSTIIARDVVTRDEIRISVEAVTPIIGMLP